MPGSPTALVHVCSPSPSDVRAEVELHKRDLNERLKRVLFNTLVVAYYTSFQPCCFVQVGRCRGQGLATGRNADWGVVCGTLLVFY